jgi:trans-aconitate 2-methyltransferase
MWDPEQYRLFAAERARPFGELIARIRPAEPAFVVDLGCGPGELTAELSRRWPGAQVQGIDSSAEMIAAARKHEGANLAFSVGDVRDWRPERPPDVIVCSAVLQWIPGHDGLVARWAAALPPGGWLAIGVPANFDQPSHCLLRELAGSARWRALVSGAQLTRQDADPARYLELLASAGCRPDVWETTYLQVLQGADPVLQWYLGTALRPVLAALDAGQAAQFTAEYGELLRQAYPRQPCGTILPFRRVFAVGRRA